MGKVTVRFKDGSLAEIDESKVGAARQRGAEIYSSPAAGRVVVKFRDGSLAEIPEAKKDAAMRSGAKVLESEASSAVTVDGDDIVEKKSEAKSGGAPERPLGGGTPNGSQFRSESQSGSPLVLRGAIGGSDNGLIPESFRATPLAGGAAAGGSALGQGGVPLVRSEVPGMRDPINDLNPAGFKVTPRRITDEEELRYKAIQEAKAIEDEIASYMTDRNVGVIDTKKPTTSIYENAKREAVLVLSEMNNLQRVAGLPTIDLQAAINDPESYPAVIEGIKKSFADQIEENKTYRHDLRLGERVEGTGEENDKTRALAAKRDKALANLELLQSQAIIARNPGATADFIGMERLKAADPVAYSNLKAAPGMIMPKYKATKLGIEAKLVALKLKAEAGAITQDEVTEAEGLVKEGEGLDYKYPAMRKKVIRQVVMERLANSGQLGGLGYVGDDISEKALAELDKLLANPLDARDVPLLKEMKNDLDLGALVYLASTRSGVGGMLGSSGVNLIKAILPEEQAKGLDELSQYRDVNVQTAIGRGAQTPFIETGKFLSGLIGTRTDKDILEESDKEATGTANYVPKKYEFRVPDYTVNPNTGVLEANPDAGNYQLAAVPYKAAEGLTNLAGQLVLGEIAGGAYAITAGRALRLATEATAGAVGKAGNLTSFGLNAGNAIGVRKGGEALSDFLKMQAKIDIPSLTMSYNQNRSEGLNAYGSSPENAWKVDLSTNLKTALEAVTENVGNPYEQFATLKSVFKKNLDDKLTRDIAGLSLRQAEGMGRPQWQQFITDAAKYAGKVTYGGVKGVAGESGEEFYNAIGGYGVDAALGQNMQDRSMLGEGVNAFIDAAATVPFLGGAGMINSHREYYSNSGLSKQSLYNVGVRADETRDMINEMHVNGTLTEKERDEKINLVNSAEQARKDWGHVRPFANANTSQNLYKAGVNYVAARANEIALQKEHDNSSDNPVRQKKLAAQIAKWQNVQGAIVDNDIAFDEEGRPSIGSVTAPGYVETRFDDFETIPDEYREDARQLPDGSWVAFVEDKDHPDASIKRDIDGGIDWARIRLDSGEEMDDVDRAFYGRMINDPLSAWEDLLEARKEQLDAAIARNKNKKGNESVSDLRAAVKHAHRAVGYLRKNKPAPSPAPVNTMSAPQEVGPNEISQPIELSVEPTSVPAPAAAPVAGQPAPAAAPAQEVVEEVISKPIELSVEPVVSKETAGQPVSYSSWDAVPSEKMDGMQIKDEDGSPMTLKLQEDGSFVAKTNTGDVPLSRLEVIEAINDAGIDVSVLTEESTVLPAKTAEETDQEYFDRLKKDRATRKEVARRSQQLRASLPGIGQAPVNIPQIPGALADLAVWTAQKNMEIAALHDDNRTEPDAWVEPLVEAKKEQEQKAASLEGPKVPSQIRSEEDSQQKPLTGPTVPSRITRGVDLPAGEEVDANKLQVVKNGEKFVVVDGIGRGSRSYGQFDTQEEADGFIADAKKKTPAPAIETAPAPSVEAELIPRVAPEEPKVSSSDVTAPVEGDTVSLPPNVKGGMGMERNMVFMDGKWQQRVGGGVTQVGETTQAIAQQKFDEENNEGRPSVQYPAKTGFVANLTPYANKRLQRYNKLNTLIDRLLSLGKKREAKKYVDEIQRDLENRLGRLLPAGSFEVLKTRGVWASGSEPSFQVKFNEATPDVYAALAKIGEEFDQDAVHTLDYNYPLTGEELINIADEDGFMVTPTIHFDLATPITQADLSGAVGRANLAGANLSEDGRVVTIYNADYYPDQESATAGAEEFSNKANALKNELKTITGVAASEGAARFRAFNRTGSEKSGKSYEWAASNLHTSSEYRQALKSDGDFKQWARSSLSGAVRKAVEAVSSISPKIANKASEHFKKLKSVGEMFDKMILFDKSPNVISAYKALTKVLKAQYRDLPIRVYPHATPVMVNGKVEWRPIYEDSAYDSSKDMRRDVDSENRMVFYLTTKEGFGSDPNADYSSHPLLKQSGFETTPMQVVDESGNPVFDKDGNPEMAAYPMLYNDVLRVVHDFVAHAASGAEFGARGEDRAWAAHVASIVSDDRFSDKEKFDGIHALTSETRGQNTWVNFVSEKNKEVNALLDKKRAAKTQEEKDEIQKQIDALGGIEFSEQKVGLLPTDALLGEYEQTKESDAFISKYASENEVYVSPQSKKRKRPRGREATVSDSKFDISELKGKMKPFAESSRNKKFPRVGEFAKGVLPEELYNKYKFLYDLADKVGVGGVDAAAVIPYGFGGQYGGNFINLGDRTLTAISSVEEFAEILNHEVIHGLLSPRAGGLTFDAYNKLNRDLEKVFKAAQDNFDSATDEVKDIIAYIADSSRDHATEDLDESEIPNFEEIVTYALTNPAFAGFLAGIKMPGEAGKNTTLWGKLKEIILDAIGTITGSKNALDAVSEILDEGFSTTEAADNFRWGRHVSAAHVAAGQVNRLLGRNGTRVFPMDITGEVQRADRRFVSKVSRLAHDFAKQERKAGSTTSDLLKFDAIKKFSDSIGMPISIGVIEGYNEGITGIRLPNRNEVWLPMGATEEGMSKMFAKTKSPTARQMSKFFPGISVPDYSVLKSIAQSASKEYADQADWYTHAAKLAKNLVGEQNMVEFGAIWGITSAQSTVATNLQKTLWAMMNARKFDLNTQQGVEDFTAAFKSPMPNGSKPLITGQQINKIVDFYKGKGYVSESNVKTYVYSKLTADRGMTTFNPFSVMDTHMMRFFGAESAKSSSVTDDQIGKGLNNVNIQRAGMYLTSHLAKELGVRSDQMQAMLWFHAKHNYGQGVERQYAGANLFGAEELESMKVKKDDGSIDAAYRDPKTKPVVDALRVMKMRDQFDETKPYSPTINDSAFGYVSSKSDDIYSTYLYSDELSKIASGKYKDGTPAINKAAKLDAEKGRTEDVMNEKARVNEQAEKFEGARRGVTIPQKIVNAIDAHRRVLKGNNLNSSIFAIPLAIYDTALLVAKYSILAGTDVAQAVDAAIDYVKSRVEGWEDTDNQLRDHMVDLAAGKKPKANIKLTGEPKTALARKKAEQEAETVADDRAKLIAAYDAAQQAAAAQAAAQPSQPPQPPVSNIKETFLSDFDLSASGTLSENESNETLISMGYDPALMESAEKVEALNLELRRDDAADIISKAKDLWGDNITEWGKKLYQKALGLMPLGATVSENNATGEKQLLTLIKLRKELDNAFRNLTNRINFSNDSAEQQQLKTERAQVQNILRQVHGAVDMISNNASRKLNLLKMDRMFDGVAVVKNIVSRVTGQRIANDFDVMTEAVKEDFGPDTTDRTVESNEKEAESELASDNKPKSKKVSARAKAEAAKNKPTSASIKALAESIKQDMQNPIEPC